MLFAPVTKIFWEKKFLIKSNASVINERGLLIVLIMPLVLPPVAAVVPARLEKANTVSSVE